MGPGQLPARGNAVAFGDLVFDLETEIGEELEVERHRLASPVVAAVLERVDVIDEVVVVDVGDPTQVLP
jgi:hypothetical protein